MLYVDEASCIAPTSRTVSSMAHRSTSSYEFEDEEQNMERHIQYNKRGELQMVGEKSLFDLNEPVWHADEKSPVCDKCQTAFTFTHRRHHCRRCGEVVCSDCMDKVPLVRMRYVDPVVVCKTCIPMCRAEDDFFKSQMQILTTGAYFNFSDSPESDTEYLCKLSADHRQITVSNGHLPIIMKQILEVKTLHGDEARVAGTGGSDADGERKKRSGSNPKSISLELVYKSGGLEQKLVLSPAPSHPRKQGSEWLRALKKALIILHNSHTA